MARPHPVTLLLALLLLATVCQPATPPQPPPETKGRPSSEATAPGPGMRVGIVLAPPTSGIAGLQGAAVREAAGRLRAAQPQVTSVRTLEPPDERFRGDELLLLAEEGVQVVCTVGLEGADQLLQLAPRFPGIDFCLLDGEFPGEIPPNAFSLSWRAGEAAMLAGAAAALATPDGGVGIVAGAFGPGADTLRRGFEAGARLVRPDVPVLVVPADHPEDAIARRQAEDGAGAQYRAAPGGARALLAYGGETTLAAVAQAAAAADGLVVGWAVDAAAVLRERGRRGAGEGRLADRVVVSVAKRFDVALAAAVRQATVGGQPRIQLRAADGAFAIVPGGSDRFPPMAARLDQLMRDLAAGRLVAP